jgi:hypothetical protein
MVHEDGHFAQKLAKELGYTSSQNVGPSQSAPPKTKKAVKKKKGLLQFFDSK